MPGHSHRGATHSIRAARVYDAPGAEDGTRVLVDRLWPRGVSRERARIDVWLKEVAPSTELRRWYAHDPGKQEEFVRRYRAELTRDAHADALRELRSLVEHGPVTLLTATKQLPLSQAAVLVAELS